jgi:hypothetical protein
MTFREIDFRWHNQPARYSIDDTEIRITTEPGTDLWQRTYYGFRPDNSPMLVWDESRNVTVTVRARFTYQELFDQCGIVIYFNEDCWCKASIEYSDHSSADLGSVVTNGGYSDWATQPIAPRSEIYFRLNRRGPDFSLESSFDGNEYSQMRVFHQQI